MAIRIKLLIFRYLNHRHFYVASNILVPNLNELVDIYPYSHDSLPDYRCDNHCSGIHCYT